MKECLIFCFLTSFIGTAQASRLMTDYFKDHYVSDSGFFLKLRNSYWNKVDTIDNKNNADAVFQLLNSSALMTVRIDKQKTSKTFDEYVKAWIPQFPQFGLDILNNKYFSLNDGTRGYVVDLINSSTQKQTRQVIFYRNNSAVILNCMDTKERFKTILQYCNYLIRTFSWSKELPSKSTIQ